jgi:hypothetical protein
MTPKKVKHVAAMGRDHENDAIHIREAIKEFLPMNSLASNIYYNKLSLFKMKGNLTHHTQKKGGGSL